MDYKTIIWKWMVEEYKKNTNFLSANFESDRSTSTQHFTGSVLLSSDQFERIETTIFNSLPQVVIQERIEGIKYLFNFDKVVGGTGQYMNIARANSQVLYS